MKTLTTTKKLFLTENGELSFFAFPSEIMYDRRFGNYQIVEMMANNGDDDAKKAIEKLRGMSSRQCSESGIYYAMQQKKSFNQTKANMYGVKMYTPVTVEFSAEISRKSKSRISAFEYNADAHGKTFFRIPYTSEMMLINKKITING